MYIPLDLQIYLDQRIREIKASLVEVPDALGNMVQVVPRVADDIISLGISHQIGVKDGL